MVFDLKLPALSWLLGKGHTHMAPAGGSQQWLAGIVGLPHLPAATLRLSAQRMSLEGEWLCLDPINLRTERTQLIVEDPTLLQLTADEADTLQQDLAPLLAELGQLHLGSPHEWHLQLKQDSPIRTTPLSEVIGLNGDRLMPDTDNIRVWRRVLTEVQMTLHEHPVNVARSTRGLPAVNSLWPWGEGKLDTTTAARWQLLQADGSLWQGLAHQLDCAWQALPERFTDCTGKTLVVHKALAAATQQHDAMRWRAALLALEEQWFAPLMQALQTGQLQAVVLHGHGEEHALTCTIKRSDRLRFWRKPAALTLLGLPA